MKLDDGSKFTISSTDPTSIRNFFDIDAILNKRDTLGANFTDDEIELLRDLQTVMNAYDNKHIEDSYNTIFSCCEKYEKKGNVISQGGLSLLDKTYPELSPKAVAAVRKALPRIY